MKINKLGFITTILLSTMAKADDSEDGFYTCLPCPAGTYLSNGTCQTCPTGTVSGSGETSCKKCPDGTYASNGLCAPCPAGNYCSNGVKKHCPAFKWSHSGAAFINECQDIKIIISRTCTACGSGPGGSGCSSGSSSASVSLKSFSERGKGAAGFSGCSGSETLSIGSVSLGTNFVSYGDMNANRYIKYCDGGVYHTAGKMDNDVYYVGELTLNMVWSCNNNGKTIRAKYVDLSPCLHGDSDKICPDDGSAPYCITPTDCSFLSY